MIPEQQEEEDSHVYEGSDLIFIATMTPKHFLCPITKDIMEDPVMTSYGQAFERKAILNHIMDGPTFQCPVTGRSLFPHDLVSNHKLKFEIQQWNAKFGEESKDTTNLNKAISGIIDPSDPTAFVAL